MLNNMPNDTHVETVTTSMTHSTGAPDLLKTDHRWLDQLFWEQFRPWKSITRDYISEVAHACEVFMESLESRREMLESGMEIFRIAMSDKIGGQS